MTGPLQPFIIPSPDYVVMKGLTENIESINVKMSAIEVKRESAIAMSRSIIRRTKNMIHAIHQGEEFMSIQGELKASVREMISKLKDEPSVLYSAVVEDAMMEYSEALILSAIVRKKDIPSFESLKITPQAWMLGLADVIGELRRIILTNLMKGDMTKASYYFDIMEEIGNEVMSFDVPDAIVPIRRKQDIARGILEKTRSDMTNATIMSSLNGLKDKN